MGLGVLGFRGSVLGFRLQSCKGCVAVLYRAPRTIDGTTEFMTRFGACSFTGFRV